jgi:hypothetical protein
MALWDLLQNGCYICPFDNLQMLVCRVALQASNGLRCIEDSNALLSAERDDSFAIEHFAFHKMLFISKEDLPYDSPHVVLRVWVEELHTPTLSRWWETAKHQQPCILRQKRLQRMMFYFGVLDG